MTKSKINGGNMVDDDNNPCEEINDIIDDIEKDIKFLCDLIEENREELSEYVPKKKMEHFDEIYIRYFGS